MKNRYDVIIIGSGHNGLVAGAYLAKAGLSVLVLEKRDIIGGATLSQKIFPGFDAAPSVYSYLVSLLPRKIVTDLDLNFELAKRSIASFTPYVKNGRHDGLFIDKESFNNLCGSDREYEQYLRFQKLCKIVAEKIWPTMLEPLQSKAEFQKLFVTDDEKEAWRMIMEEPLGKGIEKYLENDIVRGVVFTDAKIGMDTHPEDTTLLQNRTFLYHIIGQATGEWNVPIGGMGQLPKQLADIITTHGGEINTAVSVENIQHGVPNKVITTVDGQRHEIEADYVLVNAAPLVLEQLLEGYQAPQTVTGAVFKINMLVTKLPRLKSGYDPNKAFAGTFHVDEGYENMRSPKALPGEMYCHTLADDSILSEDLRNKGYQTLTFFGLNTPYEMFMADNEEMRKKVLAKYVEGLNFYLEDKIEDCLAVDSNGHPCIEAKTPIDIEQELGMPRGNIFQGNLQWPFAESEAEVGQRGVETDFSNIFLCGAGAKRGGGVSGIPGYHAAQAVLASKLI